jgi:ATP-dependent Clp protease adaptor protein ClpS
MGVCGVYTREIAETKVKMVHELARKNNFPLRCVMERE